MDQVIRQLEHVRRVGRLLLFVQRVLQGSTAVAAFLLVAAVVDYVLRLPGGLRLVIGLMALTVALVWFTKRIMVTLAFRPTLGGLAMRAERLHPQFAGVLASGIEFALHREAYQDPKRTGELVDASIDHARQQLAGRQLRGLIKLGPTLRVACVWAIVFLICGSVFASVSHEHRWLAMQRWFNPLGDSQWPKRTEVRSLVDAEIWPNDTPLPLRAQIGHGYRRGIRAWVVFRLFDAAGRSAESVRHLLTEQSGDTGRFARMVDFHKESDFLPSTAGVDHWSAVEFHFEAGDDRTARQKINLVTRPSVEQVSIEIEPPTYARGLVGTQKVELDQVAQGAGLATAPPALVGSGITLHFVLNEANVSAAYFADNWSAVLPGFANQPQAQFHIEDRVIDAQFKLERTVESGVHVEDAYGFANRSERRYRIEAVPDNPPVVSMVEPGADEAVLASAVVELEAVGRDDVGLEQLELQAQVQKNHESVDYSVVVLSLVTGRRSEMTIRHHLDLSPMGLRPGDEAGLVAVARDVFELDGVRHDPVRSSVRILRIIDEATLIAQIRNELAGLRQQAIRLATQQRRVMTQRLDIAGPRQNALGLRIATQHELAQNLQRRMGRNRLTGEQARPLQQTLTRAQGHLDEAEQASKRAVGDLEDSLSDQSESGEHVEQARRNQEKVTEALTQLAQLLDQGSDTMAIQLQVQQMLSRQQNLAADTQDLMPRTIGQPVGELDSQENKILANLKQRQQALAEQAANVVSQMESTSELLARQSQNVQDQAAASALDEAATIAQRQGLEAKMQQAGDLTQQNRLSAAGQQQEQAIDVLEQILDELKARQYLQQKILRRQLLKLAQAIRKLIEQQELQIKNLDRAVQVLALADHMGRLWRNTLSVSDMALAADQTRTVGELVGAAAEQQAVAVKALRDSDTEQAQWAEALALAKLNEALEFVEKMSADLEQQQTQAQREQLRQAYLKLASKQIELREKTDFYVTVTEANRQQRLAIVALGHEQADLRSVANDLGQEVEKTLVFERMHEWVRVAATRVADLLRVAKTDPSIPHDQTHIASILQAMAEALEQPSPDESFARGQAGGGGGGGRGGPLVPPVAELKLLRGMQDRIYSRTRVLGDQQMRQAGPGNDDTKGRLQSLSLEQREIGELGDKMIESLRRLASSPPVKPPLE